MLPHIAIVGGTGALGKGLCMRWLNAGYKVTIGTRNADKAEEIVASISADLAAHNITIPPQHLSVAANREAAQAAELVVLTVPYSHQQSTLSDIKPALQGKILIDTTVPLRPPKVALVQLPELGSAAQEAQALLNSEESDNIRVVSAFQNVAAANLQSMQAIDCDVLVCGDKESRESMIEHIAAVGVKALSAGPLANSAAQEALTSILISLNKQYKCHSGIRISGLGD